MSWELFAIAWLYMTGLVAIILWDRECGVSPGPWWHWWAVVPFYFVTLPIGIAVVITAILLLPIRRWLHRVSKDGLRCAGRNLKHHRRV